MESKEFERTEEHDKNRRITALFLAAVYQTEIEGVRSFDGLKNFLPRSLQRIVLGQFESAVARCSRWQAITFPAKHDDVE